jgi:hypothetical protein
MVESLGLDAQLPIQASASMAQCGGPESPRQGPPTSAAADRPEVALAGPEHDGYDVHAHLVDQARGQHLATNVASGDLDDSVARKPLRLGHGRLDAVD